MLYEFKDSSDVVIGTYNVGENNPDDYVGQSINGSVVSSVEYSTLNPRTIEQKLQAICDACEDDTVTTVDQLKDAIAAAIHD